MNAPCIRRAGTIVLLACIAAALAGCGRQSSPPETAAQQQPAPDATLARVGDEAITVAQLERAILASSRTERIEYVSPLQVRELLERLIDRKLMAARARAADIDVSAALASDPAGLEDDPFRREQVLADAYLRERLAAVEAVTATDVESFYRANPDEFTVPDRARITRVVLSGPGAVAEVGELLSRGLSATQIAARATPPIQADTIWVQRRAEPGPIERQTFSLPVGAVSEPFDVAAGLAMLRVDERVDGYLRPLDQISAGIEARLRQQRRKSVIAGLRAELREGAKIAIDEPLLAAYQWEP